MNTSDEIPLIECPFKDEKSLYLAYMPFVQGGGLFVRTAQNYELGSVVNLSVDLPNESDNHLVEGQVVWLTPKGAQGNKPAGIGVQLMGENGRLLANKIETHLAGMLNSPDITDTL